MASHTIAEVYAGLTKANRVPPIQAGHIIEHLLSMVDQVIELSREDYGRAVARVAADDLKGGIIYDAVLAQAARKAGADSIVTLNQKHFALVWPAEKLVTI